MAQTWVDDKMVSGNGPGVPIKKLMGFNEDFQNRSVDPNDPTQNPQARKQFAAPLGQPTPPKRGFEAYAERQFGLAGGRRADRSGVKYRGGPYGGKTQGQAFEKMRTEYQQLPDSERQQFEDRSVMNDVRSPRETSQAPGMGIREQMGLPSAPIVPTPNSDTSNSTDSMTVPGPSAPVTPPSPPAPDVPGPSFQAPLQIGQVTKGYSPYGTGSSVLAPKPASTLGPDEEIDPQTGLKRKKTTSLMPAV